MQVQTDDDDNCDDFCFFLSNWPALYGDYYTRNKNQKSSWLSCHYHHSLHLRPELPDHSLCLVCNALVKFCGGYHLEQGLVIISKIQLHHFPSVFRHCWLGGRKCIRPVKSWVLVCWWWRFDWSWHHHLQHL